MPSGQTHDRITWGCLPIVTLGVYALTQRWELAMITGISFCFSGFMFGPDLDIYSRQYQRWGLLRWIWLPYRRYIRHRSWLSHGPIVGTVVRILYLGGWLTLLTSIGGIAIAIAHGHSWPYYLIRLVRPLLQPQTWPVLSQQTGLALFVGLELGALSHYASDTLSSRLKRSRRLR